MGKEQNAISRDCPFFCKFKSDPETFFTSTCGCPLISFLKIVQVLYFKLSNTTQLILEQQGFELSRSTYRQIKYSQLFISARFASVD